MVETFIDENSFISTIWYHSMVNKRETKAVYPDMMSLLKLCVIISSSMADVECEFSAMKLLCTCLRATMLLIKLEILMQIRMCGDSLIDDAFDKVVDIYRDSIAAENISGSQTKRCKISL